MGQEFTIFQEIRSRSCEANWVDLGSVVSKKVYVFLSNLVSFLQPEMNTGSNTTISIGHHTFVLSEFGSFFVLAGLIFVVRR